MRRFFLGGQDLEMLAIFRLLADQGVDAVHDKELAWGAATSAYADEITEALAAGDELVLIELIDDLALLQGPGSERVTLIDHHDKLAGLDCPTSLEQVFQMLGLPDVSWTRELALISANDRGHCAAMQAINATRQEMEEIRRRDRQAQGISQEEESAGRAAAGAARRCDDAGLTIVELPHEHAATVTDVLDKRLGGPGYENLLILCPQTTMLFGTGRAIEALRLRFPASFSGGELPRRGFWGLPRRLSETERQQLVDGFRANWTRPATRIPVRAYRQILIWPLLLKEQPPRWVDEESPDDPSHPTDARTFDPLQPWVDRLTGSQHSLWHEVKMLSEKAASEDDFRQDPPVLSNDPTYEEIVYFHPFVRDFLFGDGLQTSSVGGRPLRCLRREDITQAGVQLSADTNFTLKVDRLELYLCEPLVALLVVEVALPLGQQMTLDEALNLQSSFRQVYPPYFSDAPGAEQGGNCPLEVSWQDESGKTVACSDFAAGRQRFADFVQLAAEPPVGRHWAMLLEPLEPFQSEHSRGHSYQQIVDDRIPGMSYIAVDDPRAIKPGDFDRLTFCDTGGKASYPFAEEFLAASRAKHCYDRYWRDVPVADTDDNELTTRFLNSGYQFVIIGRHDNGFFRTYLPAHFRRHYFRMGLIVHYTRAALLNFSEETSETMKLLGDIRDTKGFDDPRFRDRVFRIQRTFLRFRSRTWFTEVANQLQGAEIYKQWTEMLQIGSLFRQVDETSRRLYEALAEHETRKLTRSQELLAQYAMPVGVIGLALLILDLILNRT